MIRLVPGASGGVEYVCEYLARSGDVCSRVAGRVVSTTAGQVSVAGPGGAAESELRELCVSGGGFGVGGDVALFLEVSLRKHLSGGAGRVVVFELLERVDKGYSFPTFRFAPSLLGTSDGREWEEWAHGVCGYLTGGDWSVDVLRSALAECLWGGRIFFLLTVNEVGLRDVGLWTEEGLTELFRGLDAVIVPAHSRESVAVWARSGGEGLLEVVPEVFEGFDADAEAEEGRG